MELEDAWLAHEPAFADFLVRHAGLLALEQADGVPPAIVEARRSAKAGADALWAEREASVALMRRGAISDAEERDGLRRLQSLLNLLIAHDDAIETSLGQLSGRAET